MEKLLLVIFLSPFIYLFSRLAKRKKMLMHSFIVVHGIVIAFLTIFIFSKPGWFFHESYAAFLASPGTQTESARYDSIHNHFIFLDNSKDKQLIDDPDSDSRSNTSLVITNRETLKKATEVLADNVSMVDMVVYDIDLSIASPHDTSLRECMNILARVDSPNSGKLLIASAPGDTLNHILNFPEWIYGNIAEQTNERLWVSHTILADKYSLPYKLHSAINKLKEPTSILGNSLLRETDSLNKTHYFTNTFQPLYTVTDEERLYGIHQAKLNEPVAATRNESETNTRYLYNLSEIASFRKDEFIQMLANRKDEGKKNIILIGTFTSPDEDVKMTLLGPLHGTVILLNVYAQLRDGGHHLELGYITLLCGFFIVISLMVFYPAVNTPAWVTRLSNKVNSALGKHAVGKFLLATIDFLEDEFYLLMLVLLVWICNNYSNHSLNIIFLAIYFSVNAHFVRYFNKVEKEQHL